MTVWTLDRLSNMSDKISKNGRHNRKVLAEILDENGFDSKYLFEWGVPKGWEECFWNDPENVLDLLSYFEDVYKTYDSRDSLDDV